MLDIQTILCPTDFSACSEQAFQLACSMARDYGARLIVLHVQPAPIIVYGEGVVPPEPVEYRSQLKRQLETVQPQEPDIRLEHHLVEGDPATEILRAARSVKCGMIVMGTHGRSGLGRVLMGSVAEAVTRKAPCPVVTVKASRPGRTPSKESEPAMNEQVIAAASG